MESWITADRDGVAPILPPAARDQLLALKRKVEEAESLARLPSTPDIITKLETLRNEIENLEARIRDTKEILFYAGWVCSSLEDAELLVFLKGR